jgi:hypothetical protein
MSDDTAPSDDAVTEVTVEELFQELQGLQNQNEAAAMKLGQEGMPVNPYSMLSLRIDTILNSILDERNRIIFEINYENSFAVMLANIQTQLNRRKLTEGITRPPSRASRNITRP